MEIKLIIGATAFEAGKNTIKQIDVSDLQTENLVVVPDAFSMQAESLIFDCLGIKSTFNIEVVGISRLAGKILRNNNIAYGRISALEEVFNVYKALSSLLPELQFFTSCKVEICTKVLQIIKQFKACKIKPEQILSVGDEILDKKMHDLRLIYERYETLLGDKLDLSGLLEFFVKNAETKLDLSNVRLFFVNFDSFTLEINNFICSLAKYVKSVCIGMAKPLSPSNAYIYENDIFTKTTTLAKQFSVNVEVETFPTSLEAEQAEMVKNLFALNVEKTQKRNNFFLNVLTKNNREEVEYVAKYIKNAVTKGARFKDFAVAVPDEKYFQIIKDTFKNFQIVVNCDDASDLSETILGRFLLKCLEIAKLGFGRQNLEYIASSPLVLPDEDVLSSIAYFDVEDEEEFLQRFPKYSQIVNAIKGLTTCRKMKEFVSALENLVNLVQEGFENVLAYLDDERFFKEQSINLQSKELILKTLEKLASLVEEDGFSLVNFEDIVLLALKSVKVETIPSYVDAVYVGDVTDSYFEDVKTLFVLGATSDALPRTQKDVGLIDDDDIKKLRLNFALEPEIKVLNRRNRLKLFELLQHAKQKLIVSVPMSLEGKQAQKASFVEDLQKLFGDNVMRVSALEEFDLGLFSKEENLERLLFYVGSSANLPFAYTNLQTKQKLPREFISSLHSCLKTYIPVEEKIEESAKIGEKFFPKKCVSASELESFFSCPFKHFMQFGLKVKPKEDIRPNRRLFGVFEHSLLKKFVEENKNEVGVVTESQLDNFLKQNLLLLAEEVYDAKTLKDKQFLRYLKNESKIILKNVVKEQKTSDFRPIMLEEKIFEPFAQDVNLVGFVDRVDACDKFFRVIDYKTGKTDTIKTELFYGKKLQLFLYADAIKRKTGLDCAGVYYFDCQTRYAKGKKTTNLLSGITLKDNGVVEHSDKRLLSEEKSDILGISARKNVKDGEFVYKNGCLEESLTPQFEYALEISKQAIAEMKEGYIASKPFKDVCASCPYISVCRHLEEDGCRKILKQKSQKRED